MAVKKGIVPCAAQLLLEYPYRWNKTTKSLVDGYRRCPSIIREALTFFGEEFAVAFDNYLKLDAVMPHTMFFTHLGSPETILLAKEASPPGRESEAEEYWQRRDAEGTN